MGRGAEQRHINGHHQLGVERAELAGRHHKRPVAERDRRNGRHRLDVTRDRLAGKKHVYHRRIGLGHEVGTVVNLYQQRGAAVELLAHARRVKSRLHARHPGRKIGFEGVEAKAPKLRVAVARVGRVEGLGLPGGVHPDDDVVSNALVARPEFNGGNVAVGGQVHGQHENAVHVLAVALVRERVGHGNHQVGRAKLRAAGKRGHSRREGGVALGRAPFHPAPNFGYLRVGQRVFVQVMAVGGVGFPRRHVARASHVLNGLGVAYHFGVAGERKRGHFAGAVAAGAVLVHQRRNVLAKGVRRGLGLHRGHGSPQNQ